MMQERAAMLRPTKKEEPMTETIETIVKSAGGIVAISKRIADAGDALGFSEASFAAEVAKQAKADNISFERLLTNPIVVKAYRRVTEAKHVALLSRNDPAEYEKMIAKALPDIANITPVQVDGTDVVDSRNLRSGPPFSSMQGDGDVSDPQDDAFRKLQALAAALQQSSPSLSAAQAFEQVFSDRKNAALARQSLGRHISRSPGTTT